MVPPRHRDRGFSRRIQYGLFFGYVAAAMGIVVGLGLILVARFDPLAFEGIRGLALDLTAPVSGAGRGLARGAGAVGSEVGSYFASASAYRAQGEELAEARRQLVAARQLAFENRRLKGLLNLVEQGERPIVAARIAGASAAGNRRFAILAAGDAQGVRAGQPVRGPGGLIGRVAEAGRVAARVVLITDGGSTVPVRVVRTGQPALVAGRGDGVLEIRASIAGALPFVRGDLLVTSGTGGVYPPGMPVGVVREVNGEVAVGRPLADPANLDFALVLPEAAPLPPSAAPIGAVR
jgi:rod shape-determining protein MreC